MTVFGATLIAASGLALIHLLSGKLRFLDAIPRNRWLSIAGGVAVAYAVVHLLPELHAHQQAVESTTGDLPFAEHLVYLPTLLGVVLFYGLERIAQQSKQEQASGTTGVTVYWLHMSSYAFYNVLIGYLLVRQARSPLSLLLFFVGIGFHFLVNDHGLRQHHKDPYHRSGRWVLSAAILLGWSLGATTAIHDAITASVVAFLTGGILLNTFKEELPEERNSRFGVFALAAFGYAAIMLAA